MAIQKPMSSLYERVSRNFPLGRYGESIKIKINAKNINVLQNVSRNGDYQIKAFDKLGNSLKSVEKTNKGFASIIKIKDYVNRTITTIIKNGKKTLSKNVADVY